VAPNSITVLAFFCSLIPHLIILHFAGEDLSVEIPGWMALACGIGQFLYMHLDNMDGK
jgi:phosphatidylglycerophosphate synthase